MEPDDRELIVVMRRYFAVKAELAALRAQLEAERKAAGAAIGMFYDPRQNLERAAELQLSHRLKGEMVSLMQRAEAWGRAALAVGVPDRSEAEAEPEEWQSFEKRADTLFGA
ncbi:hypothetical protein [Ensifer adhaerens]|uniref:hypothetical protein n=1 Tax=Ensifer adhaerens TaxID=106592 RepID=UPI0008072D7B|nr:hypothetical protein [Ensifer adhaerens]